MDTNAQPITWSLRQFAISDLTDYSKNPRSLTKEQYRQLKASLDRFGLIDKPIVNLDPLNTVIGGHQRLRVLRDEGVSTVECWIPDRSLSDKEIEELNIRLNKNTGEWDMDILSNQFEIPDLMEWGFRPFELGIVGDPNDPCEEWSDMPEFDQEENFGAFHTIKIHFPSLEALHEFSTLISQTVNEKTKWLWFPKQERLNLKVYHVADES